MTVIGIDLGNENCCIATICSGGVEVLANESGSRSTPAYVGFGERSRVFGISAKGQHVTNVSNTIFGCKRLIGKKTSDRRISYENSYAPFRVYNLADDFCGVQVTYKNVLTIFSVQQIVAMLLAKLKETAQIALGCEVTHCVLSVPSFFTDTERRALLDAGRISGLNIVRLLNDSSAVALSYGFFKDNLPETKSRIVVFIDLGHTSFQISACCLKKGNFKVMATYTDSELGGRDFNNVLVRHFAKEFEKKHKINVLENTRATIRLIDECEKLKKQLSANPQALPLNIECFIDDLDVSGSVCRDAFEELSADLIRKAELTMRNLLAIANLKPSDIYTVELVGGSSRIPAIKVLVQKVFLMEPSTTLNLDEAVARGCALYCAMLMPNLKVKQLSLTDVQHFPIKLMWEISPGEKGEVEVFQRNHQFPFSKYLTFYQKEPFTLHAYYGVTQYDSTPEDFIGSFTIKNVTKTPSGESSKVRVKIRIDIHGIFSVRSAVILSRDDDDSSVPDQKLEDQMDITGNIIEPEVTNQENEKSSGFFMKKQKKITKAIVLPVQVKVPEISSQLLVKLIDNERDMQEADKSEKERVDTKNNLEEFIYEMKSMLDDLEKFMDAQACEKYKHELETTANWLYERGELQTKEVYGQRLKELKVMVDPFVFRKHEFDAREATFEKFQEVIQNWQSFLESNINEKYDHLTEEDIEKMQTLVQNSDAWFITHMKLLSEAPLLRDPPILISQFIAEIEKLEKALNKMLKRPKKK